MAAQTATSHDSGLFTPDGFHYGSSDKLWVWVVTSELCVSCPCCHQENTADFVPNNTVLQSSLD